MSEKLPASLVQDKVKAEVMAYAEVDDREKFISAKAHYDELFHDDNHPFEERYWSFAESQSPSFINEKKVALKELQSRERHIDSAVSQGEIAGQAYDERVARLSDFALEQQSTRGDGTVEKTQTYSRNSVDFSFVKDHISIHQGGEIAGSQFDNNVFPTNDDVINFIKESLPAILNFDQHGMTELTFDYGKRVGFTGVKPIDELKSLKDVKLTKANRIPGGEPAVVDGISGAWYPEKARNPETGNFEVVLNNDGSIKNPHGQFIPEANIAEVPQEAASDIFETSQISVIIRKDANTGQPIVVTIFPGELAPAGPVKISTETYNLDTLNDPKINEYWDSHAFIKVTA